MPVHVGTLRFLYFPDGDVMYHQVVASICADSAFPPLPSGMHLALHARSTPTIVDTGAMLMP